MGYGENCGMVGDMDPDPSYGGWNKPDPDYACDYDEAERARALYTFYSEEALVTSAVFQKHLGMALAHKDRAIEKLRAELWELHCAKTTS